MVFPVCVFEDLEVDFGGESREGFIIWGWRVGEFWELVCCVG